MGVTTLICIIAFGVWRRRIALGIAAGFFFSGIASNLHPVLAPAFIAMGCALIWRGAEPPRPTGQVVQVAPSPRVAIADRLLSSPIVIGAFALAILAAVALTVGGAYPPGPRPMRINAWVAGLPWIFGSVALAPVAAAQLERATNRSLQVIYAAVLGWGLPQIFLLLVWLISGPLFLLCDAGSECF